MKGLVGTVIATGVLALAACSNPQQTAPGSQASAPAAPPPAPKVLPPKDAVPLKTGAFAEWDAKVKAYTVDGWTLTLSDTMKDGDEVPVLTVVDDQGRKVTAVGEASETSMTRIGAGRIDPRGDGDQIVMTSYTGGAHCCTRIQVLDRVGGQWKVIDLGMWDGDGADFPKAQVPGAPLAFWLNDNRFAYAFTDYADSWMPPRFYEINGGRLIETSQAKRYAPLYEKDMADAKASCLKHDNPNGACAGMVADAARLGRRADGWKVMLANYDKGFDWTLGAACKVRVAGDCPKDQQVPLDFPAALENALVQDGYMRASDAKLATSRPDWPTFHCDKVTSANLKLVCDTPDLAVADYDVAFEYARAMANSRDPDALRASQEAFDRSIVNAPHDAKAIRRLYEKRVVELARM